MIPPPPSNDSVQDRSAPANAHPASAKRRRASLDLYVIALAVAAPFFVSPYMLGEVTFVAIMAIGGLSLTVLTGWSGQVSLGQAAFVGIGAYIHAIALSRGVPWPGAVLLAMMGGALSGALVGLPALRLSGLHLLVVTLASGILVEQLLGRWSSVTGGHQGFSVSALSLPGLSDADPLTLYATTMISLLVVWIGMANLMRNRMGRAWQGLRDSEAVAEALGVAVERSKLLAFIISGSVAALAGCLLAHQLQYITPEAFGLTLSLQLLVIVKVSGSSGPRGALIGACIIGFLPTVLSAIKPYMPPTWAARPGLETFIYGLLLFSCVMWESRSPKATASVE